MGDSKAGNPRASCVRFLAGAMLRSAAIIVAAGLWAPAPAEAQIVNCLTLWPTRIADWGEWTDTAGNPVNDLPCEEYRPAEVRATFAEFGAEVHIYVYKDRDPDRNAPHPYATPDAAELVKQAMYDAMTVLKPVHPGVDMTAVLLPTIAGQRDSVDGSDWNWGTLADARGREPCPVSIYLSTLMKIPPDGSAPTPRTPDSVKATVAHEVYHCYQFKYFAAQMAIDRGDNDWWLEATAKHFELLVYGCPDPRWAAKYNRRAPTYQATEGGYENLAFFGYLGKMEGFDVAAQSAFLGAMPTENGEALQHQALAGRPEMGGRFHRFAQQFLDRTVPCVGPYLDDRGYVSSAIEGQGEILMQAGPFATDIYEVLLKKGKVYRMRFTPISGGPPGDANRVSFRQSGLVGDWQTVAAGESSLITGCSGDSYLFVASNAGAGDEPFEFSIEFELDEQATAGIDGNCDGKCTTKAWGFTPVTLDRCLVGEWELVSGGSLDYINRVTRFEEERNPDFKSFSGADGATGNRLSIRVDGTYEYGQGSAWRELTLEQWTNREEGEFSRSFTREDYRTMPEAGVWDVKKNQFRMCATFKPRKTDYTAHTVVETVPCSTGNCTTDVSASSNQRRLPRRIEDHFTQHVSDWHYNYTCTDGELRIFQGGGADILAKAAGAGVSLPPEASALTGMPGQEWLYRRISRPPTEGDGQ